jgi:hypothetical protein
MTRRQWLWITGLSSLALFVVLAILDRKMTDTGGPGIIGFELAGSEHRAHEILADWGSSGHDAAKASLWLDYPYLVLYAAFYTLAVAALRDSAVRRGWTRLASIGSTVVFLPILGAALDALEDVGLLLALGRHGGNAAPLLATIFAVGKFACLFATLAYALAWLVTLVANRSRPATP